MAKQKKQLTHDELRSKLRWGIAGIFALIIVSAAFDAPTYANKFINGLNAKTGIGLPTLTEQSFKLGLDLQGGAQLVYEANVFDIEEAERATAVEGVRDVIERRVNGIGVGEAVIQTAKVGDAFRINVELPGVSDINQAIEMIGETPILEFKEENTEPARSLTSEELEKLEIINETANINIDTARERVLAGEDFAAVALELSQDATSKNNGGSLGYINERSLPEFYEWASTATVGSVSPVIEVAQGFSVLRLNGEKPGAQEVKASHILICHEGVVNCNSVYSEEEARALAGELFERANAGNFAALATEFSVDSGSNANGGDLGYFQAGSMIPAFEEAVFGAENGQIIGPVKTDLGYHIVYKQDERIQPEFDVSHIFTRKISEIDILPDQDEWVSTLLSGSQLERAEVVTDHQTSQIQVSLQFDAEGSQLFKELTEKHVGEPIAIFLDGEPISIPLVNQPISGGQAVITGNFDIQEAQLLAQRLNAGALPVPVELIAQQGIGASLGQASLEKSLKAGVVGLLIVAIFMLLYYRVPGLLAVIALTLYITLTMAVFKFIGVTLSLAGIAGVILSIGMAVDANVLIYERLREEMKRGNSLKQSAEDAFTRAWPSIRDGNISTLITCFLLMWFGSSFVQGFAITLGIGVLMSMFSAITVSRVLLRYIVPWFDERTAFFFLGGKK